MGQDDRSALLMEMALADPDELQFRGRPFPSALEDKSIDMRHVGVALVSPRLPTPTPPGARALSLLITARGDMMIYYRGS